MKGFIYGQHVSPITVESNGNTLRFRDENGRPLWSGMRLGPNAQQPAGEGSWGARDGNGSGGDGWGRNRTQG